MDILADDEEVSVSVRDSGPGVAPELADEVFRRGYTTKAAADGHGGLGLALTRLVCTRRGGSITVNGSTFTASVPFPAMPSAPSSGVESHDPGIGR